MRTVTESLFHHDLPATATPPRVVAGGNAAVPWSLLGLVDRALPAYSLFMLNAPRGIPDREGVTLETPFVGAGMRGRKALRYIPSRLSQVPHLFHTTCPPDIVCLHTSSPRNGKVSLGVEVNILPAAIEAARARAGLVIAQVNAAMPYTYGDGEIDVDSIDAVVEVDEPLMEHGNGRPQGYAVLPELERIGKLVSSRVGDAATLQLGIGLVPDAVLPGLLNRQGLGIWSEMISDGVLALDRAGALDADRRVVASFVLGSRDLYDWVDGNPQVQILRTEATNDPALVAANPAMTSINTALEVDLFGQANASRINARIHSGFGGQPDFVSGALHSQGGQALMALRSWHPRADVSTVVPLIDEPVTSFQHTAVVTENGVAEIWGQDERTQAAQLIDEAAHPQVREELWEEARALGLA